MSLKAVVGWALAISIVVLGSIILLGSVRSQFLTVSYFLFMGGVLLCVILLSRAVFKDSSDWVFLMVVALVFAAFLAYLATAYQSYTETSKAADQMEHNLAYELQSLSTQNDYYSKYVDYLKAQISGYHNSSLSMQAKIDSLKRQPAKTVPPIAPPPIQAPAPAQPIIIPDDRFGEEYEDD